MRFTSEYKMVGFNFSYIIIDFYLLTMTIQIALWQIGLNRYMYYGVSELCNAHISL